MRNIFIFIAVLVLIIVGVMLWAARDTIPSADEPEQTEAMAALTLNVHKAKRGDTYESIAKEYDLDPVELADYNLDREVKKGTMVVLPPDREVEPTPQPQPSTATPQATQELAACVDNGIVDYPHPDHDATGYVIETRAGDTIQSLAAEHQVSSVDIVEQNTINNVDCLKAGTMIYILKGRQQ